MTSVLDRDRTEPGIEGSVGLRERSQTRERLPVPPVPPSRLVRWMGWMLALVLVVVAGVVIYDRTGPSYPELAAWQVHPEEGRPADPRLIDRTVSVVGAEVGSPPAPDRRAWVGLLAWQVHPEEGRPADPRLVDRGATPAG